MGTLRSPVIFPSPLRRNTKLSLRLYCPATGMRSRYFCMPRYIEHVNTPEFRQCRQRNPTSIQKRQVATYQSDVARGYLHSCTSCVLYLWSPAVKTNNRSRHDMNLNKRKSDNLITLWFLCIFVLSHQNISQNAVWHLQKHLPNNKHFSIKKSHYYHNVYTATPKFNAISEHNLSI
jgi:hypothetical protein